MRKLLVSTMLKTNYIDVSKHASHNEFFITFINYPISCLSLWYIINGSNHINRSVNGRISNINLVVIINIKQTVATTSGSYGNNQRSEEDNCRHFSWDLRSWIYFSRQTWQQHFGACDLAIVHLYGLLRHHNIGFGHLESISNIPNSHHDGSEQICLEYFVSVA